MQEKSNFIIYKASAGSGKTYTLAKEVIKILVQNPYDFNKILAVTFTKKATAEMKLRIIENLSKLHKNEDKANDLCQQIIQEIKDEQNVDISSVFDKNVQIALQLILHNYSQFNISTIDSFFQGIIRSFAKELDLPIGMEIELDTDSVIQYAVQELLKEYRYNKDAFSNWIESYVFDLMDDEKSWKIEDKIADMAKQLLSEDFQLLATTQHDFNIKSYEETRLKLKEIIQQFKTFIDKETEKIETIIQAQNVDLALFYQGTRSVQSFIKKAKNYEPEANTYVAKMLNNEVEIIPKKKNSDLAENERHEQIWNAHIKPYIETILQHKEKNEKLFNSADIVWRNIYSLALLEFINQKIKEYKADNDLMLISDANQIVSVIAQYEEIPFLFEKSANFLKYILIDEFQDTSTLQWRGMLPLLLEILQKLNGTVLIVGDPKQSIYRWRGGKMELIVHGIAKDMPNEWKESKNIPLTDNYRSAKEIIQFNNAFFHAVKEELPFTNLLFKDAYVDVEQNIIHKNKQGYIQCTWLEKEKKQKKQAQDNESEEEKIEKTDKHLEEILNTISNLKNTHTYSDIAILTRTNTHGSLIANYLQENNIPVVSAESLLLNTHFPIKWLIAMLQYVLSPTEHFYKIKANYLYAQLIGFENAKDYLSNGEDLLAETSTNFNLENMERLSSLSVNELLFLIMQDFEVEKITDDYILRFQDVVFQFEQNNTGTLRAFLEYWATHADKLSILPPEGLDAVKIMTIHKSKGLQFPVVILPYATWSMNSKSDSMVWVKNETPPFNQLNVFPILMLKKAENSIFNADYQQEADATYIDNINLLYVAFTRAEEQLYIISNEEAQGKDPMPKNVSGSLKLFISNLNLEQASLDTSRFKFGKQAQTKKDAQKQNQTLIIHPSSSKTYQTKLKLQQRNEYNEAQIKGNILHEILSKITNENEIEKAVKAVAANDVDYYMNEAKKVMQLFKEKNWLTNEWTSLNERAVYYKNENLRADKVLWNNDTCIIIDFKTGAKENNHIQQIKKYKEAYTQLLSANTQAYLLYTDTLELQAI